VYAGFGALMITSLISYVSHSQVGMRVSQPTGGSAPGREAVHQGTSNARVASLLALDRCIS
jgi:hypothetical protein